MENANSGRKKNVIRNSSVGLIVQTISIFLSFLGRSIFIKYLGTDYLGLNGLFTNILSVLSVADLGCNSVFLYNLYKPVYENDKEKIGGLILFYRKAYTLISVIILVGGLLFLPMLPFITDTSIPSRIMFTSYILLLVNSVASYWAVYKSLLITAYQKNYITSFISLFINIIKTILQILSCILYSNFILYICIQIVCTLLNNIILHGSVGKMFPDIDYYIKNCNRNKDSENNILSSIKSMMGYKLGLVAVNNTDNILISVLVNTATVGLYSNYSMVISACTTFIGTIYNGIQSSIGNLNAGNDKHKQYNMFKIVLLFYNYIGSLGVIGFYFLFNSFIGFWVGSKYTLSSSTVFIIALNFYISSITNPVLLYRETYGLFKKVTPIVVCTAIANILLSVILGKIWGLSGILGATIISKAITIVWYEPMLVFKRCFDISVKEYWKKQTKYVAITIISFLIFRQLQLVLDNQISVFLVNVITICFILTIIYIITFWNTEEMQYIRSLRRKNGKRNSSSL